LNTVYVAVSTAWTGKDDAFMKIKDTLERIMNGEQPEESGDDLVSF
jgi:hypothetical protein